ncbi:MAG: hypothetical protein PHC61_07910, partial [Chitinivibrionales bacterium]|nr:hypothetical protein [Chitinivibrionales bacterium]
LRFPIRLKNEGLVHQVLKGNYINNLGIAITYPQALDELPQLKECAGDRCPNARLCARTLVTLPVHGYVTDDDLRSILKMLERICKQ